MQVDPLNFVAGQSEWPNLNCKAGNEFYEPKSICLDMRHATSMKVNNNNNEKQASKMRVFKK